MGVQKDSEVRRRWWTIGPKFAGKGKQQVQQGLRTGVWEQKCRLLSSEFSYIPSAVERLYLSNLIESLQQPQDSDYDAHFTDEESEAQRNKVTPLWAPCLYRKQEI